MSSEDQRIRNLETKVDKQRKDLINLILENMQKISDNGVSHYESVFKINKDLRLLSDTIDSNAQRIEALERRINAMSAAPAASAPDAEMVASTGLNSFKIKY